MATIPSVVDLPRTTDVDPSKPTLEDALDRIAEETAPIPAHEKLLRMAAATGNIADYYTEEKLTEIGARAVDDYERDKSDRQSWEDIAREAIAACSQEEVDKAKDSEKTFPWPNASNMRWPLLTTAALQFNARMYPSIVKGDEAVLCKVIGQDNGTPVMAPNPRSGEIQPLPQMDPATGRPKEPPEPEWQVPPGAKAKRARRVSEYLNTQLFYRMENWEEDTDALLMQLPAAGCVFRKCWMDDKRQPQSATISALNLIVPVKSRSLATALRITEEIEDVYPHEIEERMRSGFYRRVDLSGVVGPPKPGEAIKAKPKLEGDGGRKLLEQHCRWDFDGDGLEEPYIIIVDHETRQVLRIEPNFGPDDITWQPPAANDAAPVPIRVQPRQFYVKYGMFPHPGGKFYDLGLGHLLKRLGDVINTSINQILDAGTAAAAGGGFIGSGVRLQARGNRGVIRLSPGEYKVVDAPGDNLRNAIVERTLPTPSAITFQVLDLILGAARDVAGIKDVMTGEAPNTGQVGTTLALIEQGLQVFNATAKRIFRNLKAEFELLFINCGDFGGDAMAQDYRDTLDDPEADFAADFAQEGLDIRPVSDPASITRMQKMAKAQFKLGLLPQIMAVGGDGREVIKRVLEAVDEEDIDKILPPPPPADPMQQEMQMRMLALQMRSLAAKAGKDEAGANAAIAQALKDAATAQQIRLETSVAAGQHGMEMGATAAATEGQQ